MSSKKSDGSGWLQNYIDDALQGRPSNPAAELAALRKERELSYDEIATLRTLLRGRDECPPLKVKLLREGAKVPVRAHPTDSGLDCFAVERTAVGFMPTRVRLGIGCEIPDGYELQIRPRSSSSVAGLHCALGTIDQGYTGEIAAVMWSLNGHLVIEAGQKVCQLVMAPVAYPEVQLVEELSETARGGNGFGSTDKE